MQPPQAFIREKSGHQSRLSESAEMSRWLTGNITTTNNNNSGNAAIGVDSGFFTALASMLPSQYAYMSQLMAYQHASDMSEHTPPSSSSSSSLNNTPSSANGGLKRKGLSDVISKLQEQNCTPVKTHEPQESTLTAPNGTNTTCSNLSPPPSSSSSLASCNSKPDEKTTRSDHDLHCLLERANLLQYYDAFVEQGGDDLNQLREADAQEFDEIIRLVGMASKPLHVKRLRKALDEHFARKDLSSNDTGRSMPASFAWLPNNYSLMNNFGQMRNFLASSHPQCNAPISTASSNPFSISSLCAPSTTSNSSLMMPSFATSAVSSNGVPNPLHIYSLLQQQVTSLPGDVSRWNGPVRPRQGRRELEKAFRGGSEPESEMEPNEYEDLEGASDDDDEDDEDDRDSRTGEHEDEENDEQDDENEENGKKRSDSCKTEHKTHNEQNEKTLKKNKVIELYTKGERCVRKLSQITGVPLTTVYRVIGKLKGINYNIPRGNGAGRKTILDGQDREILVEILNAQPRISRKALGRELERRTGKSIHNSTLNRELCRLRHHGLNAAVRENHTVEERRPRRAHTSLDSSCLDHILSESRSLCDSLSQQEIECKSVASMPADVAQLIIEICQISTTHLSNANPLGQMRSDKIRRVVFCLLGDAGKSFYQQCTREACIRIGELKPTLLTRPEDLVVYAERVLANCAIRPDGQV